MKTKNTKVTVQKVKRFVLSKKNVKQSDLVLSFTIKYELLYKVWKLYKY